MAIGRPFFVTLVVAAFAVAAHAAPGDATTATNASVDRLYAASAEEYLKVLKAAQIKSGYPKGSMSPSKDAVKIQYVNATWITGPMLQWLILDNQIRLQVSDDFVRDKYPRAALAERKSRALGMYQCMNMTAKLLVMAQKSGARPAREGNTVADGLRLCALANLEMVE